MACCAAGVELDSAGIACERGPPAATGAASCIEIDLYAETLADAAPAVSGQGGCHQMIPSQGHHGRLKVAGPVVRLPGQRRHQSPWRREQRVKLGVSHSGHKKKLVMHNNRSRHTCVMVRESAFKQCACMVKSLDVRNTRWKKGDMGGSLNNSSVSSSFQETTQVGDQDFERVKPLGEYAF